jgi:HD-GYP domain-containing protein (c-di-GMP phosphodiesterase class II)
MSAPASYPSRLGISASTMTEGEMTSAVSSSLAGHTTAYCRELLERAVGSLAGTNGAVFVSEGRGRVRLVVGGNGSATSLRLMEDLGRRALMEGSPQLLTIAHLNFARLVPSSNLCLAIPVFLDDIVVLVVVLDVDVNEPALPTCMELLEPMLAPIALSVDGMRMQAALEARGEEIAALRGQLDAYAFDFRSTYLAERSRSAELNAALGQLEATYKATLRGLAIAVDAKDECTGGHLQRVTRYGMMLTGLVAPEHARDPQFEYGFLLHDIGKLTVPDVVLTKPGSLTESEWELVRQHPESGRSILEDIPFLAGAREIVHSHHERWDGKGYPRGLARDEIPLGAQIFPLCDAFDAMTSDRPYRQALPIEEALAELRRGTGTQFWPTAVEAFLSLPLDDLQAVRGGLVGRLM